ncbi:MAG: hypothetical protein RBR08_05755 [Desulforegulaceae bacterium]|nr:hypothetical protein [Desulforegulaceae bacterium]
MKKYKNFFNLFILLFVFLSISGCFASKNAFDKNKQLYNKYISSNNTQYYYAEKIIENISDREKYNSYHYFKTILSLKTEPFDKNIEKIKKIKNKKIKIDACIQGANKYITLKQYDLSKKFILIAEKELLLLTDKNHNLDFQIAVLYNQLLQTALKNKNHSLFEKICFNLIKSYKKNYYRLYELRPLLIPFKKYFFSCQKNQINYSKKILRFAETIAWEMEPDKEQIIPQYEVKPNLFELIHTAFFNPERQRALSLIELAEIYSFIDQPLEIYPIYIELVDIWKNSLKNPDKGKSFELYLPGFIKILYKKGYKNEAIYFTSIVPDIFPFRIKKNTDLKRQALAYHQFKLREYNKKGNFHRYRCFKSMVLQINKEKGSDFAIEWIKKNIKDTHIRLKLFSDLSYIEKHKNLNLINEIQNIYPEDEKEKITSDSLKYFYIPILINLYSSNKLKADKFLLLIIDKISKEYDEDQPVLLARLARALKHINYKQSHTLCNKSFVKAYSIPQDDPITSIKSVQLLIKIIGKNQFDCIDYNYFTKYLYDLIEHFSIHGNKERLYEIKIDCLILAGDLFNYLGDKKQSLNCLKNAEKYIQIINNKELANSYTFSLFSRYADFEFFSESFKISEQINFEFYDKDYFIGKITELFILNKYNEKRWLLFDIDNDKKIDFINPEADKELLKLHMDKVVFNY